jgi:hypothetical protein
VFACRKLFRRCLIFACKTGAYLNVLKKKLFVISIKSSLVQHLQLMPRAYPLSGALVLLSNIKLDQKKYFQRTKALAYFGIADTFLKQCGRVLDWVISLVFILHFLSLPIPATVSGLKPSTSR